MCRVRRGISASRSKPLLSPGAGGSGFPGNWLSPNTLSQGNRTTRALSFATRLRPGVPRRLLVRMWKQRPRQGQASPRAQSLVRLDPNYTTVCIFPSCTMPLVRLPSTNLSLRSFVSPRPRRVFYLGSPICSTFTAFSQFHEDFICAFLKCVFCPQDKKNIYTLYKAWKTEEDEKNNTFHPFIQKVAIYLAGNFLSAFFKNSFS